MVLFVLRKIIDILQYVWKTNYCLESPELLSGDSVSYESNSLYNKIHGYSNRF